MDPDACLAELLELKESLKKKVDKYGSWTDLAEAAPAEEVDELITELDDLVNHIDALNGWLRSGGFLPKGWQTKRGRKRNEDSLNAATLTVISETLWPRGDPDHEWSSNELENIGILMRNAGFGPKEVDSSKPE